MKKLFIVLIVLMICVASFPNVAYAVENYEAQEAQSPEPVEIIPDYSWYSADKTKLEIKSVEQLAALGKLTQGNVVVGETTYVKTNFADKTVTLVADISFAGEYWYYKDANNKVITNYCIYDFAGIFNGNEKTISGLQIKAERTVSQVGLFKNIVSTGEIINLTIDGVSFDLVDNNSSIGSIAGQFFGTATNCHVKNMTVVVGMNTAQRGYIAQGGGLFGYVKSATVKECTATNINMTFSGNDNTDRVGALIGQADGTSDNRTTITDCTVSDATFYCTCKTKHFGAFVGQTHWTNVTNCHISNIVITTLDWSYHTGGFVGNVGSGSVYQNCTVTGFKMTDMANGPYYYSGNIGGFAGYVGGTEVSFTDCTATKLDFDLEFANDYSCGVGGFAGYVGNNGATITGCAASGDITASGGNSDIPVGGFIGESHGGLNISGCDTSVDVTAPDIAGGFIGACNKGVDTYTDCEATGNVTSTNVAAGGFVGYVQNDATPSFGDGCVASSSVNGPITNEIANAQDKIYEIDADDNITSKPVNWVCSVKISPSYSKGYSSIQAAVDEGANKVTLLDNSTESFTLDRGATDAFTLDLGAFTYNGVVTVPHEIASFTVNGTTSDGSSIVITEPFKDHYAFDGWCNGKDNVQNIASKTTNGWIAEIGQAYHTHFTESLYEHEELHPDFGEIYYGDSSEARNITFGKENASDEDMITECIAEKGYFDVSFKGLTLTIAPKAGLDAGTHEEVIHVRLSDNSTHGVTAKVTVKKAQAVINMDMSDIVIIQGREWQLPSASSNFGVVKTDIGIDDMKDVGVYTVTYSVEETRNYAGDSKQIEVTVILDPSIIQENLNNAVQELYIAIDSKATLSDIQFAIDNLTKAYKNADKVLSVALKEGIDANATAIADLQVMMNTANEALQKTDEALAADIEAAKNDLQSKIENLKSEIKTNIDELYANNTAVKESIAELKALLMSVESEFKSEITAMQKTLEEDRAKLEKELNDKDSLLAQKDAELAQKDAELEEKLMQQEEEHNDKITMFIVLLSICGAISLCSVGVTVFFIVKKRVI